MLEICIIELAKAKKQKEEIEREIKPWLDFIENPKEMEMTGMSKENEEAIKAAKKVLEEISQDEHERYIAELRQKHIMDQKAIEDFGYNNGLADGRKQGATEEKIEIAKKMIKEKASIEFIMSVTGLTKEEIEKLNQE